MYHIHSTYGTYTLDNVPWWTGVGFCRALRDVHNVHPILW